MVRKLVSCLVGGVLLVFSLPGMIDDWEAWRVLLSDWQWYNFALAVVGIAAIVYGTWPVLAWAFGIGGGNYQIISREKLQAVLEYELEDGTTVRRTMKQVVIAIIVFPPAVVLAIIVIGLGFYFMGHLVEFGFNTLMSIIELLEGGE